jgi:hypothetical protein
MSLLLETAIFYSLIGCGVAVAIFVRGDARSQLATLAPSVCAIVFWPLFVPMLLASSPSDTLTEHNGHSPQPPTDDSMTAAINQVETELDAALEGLDGWAENVLADESPRLEEPNRSRTPTPCPPPRTATNAPATAKRPAGKTSVNSRPSDNKCTAT